MRFWLDPDSKKNTDPKHSFLGTGMLIIQYSNYWKQVAISVVDQNALNLNPDPGFWSNLDPDPYPGPDTDPDPGYVILSILKEKILNILFNYKHILSHKGIFSQLSL